jgi:AcrR family transcriptional regulator
MSLKPRPGRGRPPLSDDQRVQMREAIAAAARRVFLAEGYGSVSLRRLAGEVGCTPMALYTYYDSKLDILRRLWAEVFDAAFAEVERARTEGATPALQLKAMACAYVRYWLDHPDHYRLVFMSAGVTQGDVTGFVEADAVATRYAVFATALGACVGRNDVRTATHAEALICGVIGVAHSHITVSGHPWSAADTLVDILVEGTILSAAKG